MARYIEESEAIECIKFGAYFGFTPIQSIEHTPTADVQEVVHAKWIYNYNWHGDIEDSGCSKCTGIVPGAFHTRYCPHCGARMDAKGE